MKKLSLRKNKWFAGLLAIELCILLCCAGIMIFRKDAVYTCRPEDFTVTQDGGIASKSLTLPRGVYRVELRYDCEGNMQNFANMEEIGQGGCLLSSGQHISGGLGYTDFDLWVRGRTEAYLQISAGGEPLEILDLSIYQTDGDMTRAIVILVVLSLVVDALFIVREYHRQYGLSGRQLKILAGLALTVVLASIPVFVGYIYPGSDVTYHLLRIDNIKDGLLSGQFPVRIDPSWLWGHGYASSVCYGETLLYIPAVMRLLGFTLQESYMSFLFLLNLGTCLTAWFCFRGIFRSSRLGMFCTVLYMLSIYRLFKMYSWAALGEVQAMLWLPLILYAVYRLLADDVSETGYKRKWIPLAIGFSGVIQCHVLTCELTVFFLIIICIVFWKRLFRKETFLAFVKGVLGTCALSAWFIVPFLEYTFGVDMIIHHVSARTIQEVGLYPANLLLAFFHRGSSRNLELNGMIDMEALGVGITMTAAAGVMLFLWFWGFLREQKENRILMTAGKAATVLSIAAMVMSLAIFPWTRIQFLNPVFQVLISSIQYPNRFLMTATLLLTFAGGVVLVCVRGQFGSAAEKGTEMCFLAMAGITALFYISSIVTDAGSLYMYDAKGIGTGYLSGAEYLRYGVDTSRYSYHGPEAGSGVEITDYDKEWLDVDFLAWNHSDGESYVDLPLQNYRGYIARTDTGQELMTCDGENMDLRVLLPDGFNGSVQIRFRPPWYWRCAEAVSLLSIASLIVWLFVLRRKRNLV